MWSGDKEGAAVYSGSTVWFTFRLMVRFTVSKDSVIQWWLFQVLD